VGLNVLLTLVGTDSSRFISSGIAIGPIDMDDWQRFEAICQAMAAPSFYPHPVLHLERRDTHISVVFLTGDWVYKLKKPVDFIFLDFRDLSARRHFCYQEVALNQRFSHDVYQGVSVICRGESGQLVLDGPGEVVEYAVKMRQLPEAACLKERLKQGVVRHADMHALGRFLADFYQGAVRSSEIDRYGLPEVVGFNVEENFRQVEPFQEVLLDARKLALIRSVSHSFLGRWQALFARRLAAGRIRDGHGDLRTDHIYFHDGIQVIDCIEFNERFRFGDVTADLAFLTMDMQHRGRSGLARVFLAAYASAAHDPEVYLLLDFYAAYRAMVMVKVHCLRYAEVDETDAALRAVLRRQVRLYLDQAYRYAVQFSRPTLWVFCGLPASGKSTLAAEIAQIFGLPLFQSDWIRKKELPRSPHVESMVARGEGLYRPEITTLVYGRLLALAQEQLKQGHSVILDATYARRKWREDALQLAQDVDADVLFVECVCSGKTLRDRLAARERQPGLSDARLGHLAEFLERFEPIEEVRKDRHLRLHTDVRMPDAFAKLLSSAYAKKCAQVLRRLRQRG
jgi:aminoglycoside phosphotransferase family enzyme/predicted kinase